MTNLGLTYNLLTAYTSFVAIDTEVRLINGQPVTVKQPLPLPEGVSDYAVGKGMMAQKAASPYRLSSIAGDKDACREVDRKEERLASKPVRISVDIAEISTTGGLSKEALQKALKQQIPFIELCYQKALEKTPNIQGKVNFELSIDSKGRVIKVNLISSKLNEKTLEQCIIQKIKELSFPSIEGKVNVTATVSFNLRSS